MKKIVPLFLAAVFALVGCKTNKEDEGGNQDASTYAVWPTEDMAIVVKGVKNDSTEVIPPFEHADKIEIEWEKFLDDGYFTIELETTKQESQNEYKTVLENAGWDFGENDEDGYYNAFSPKGDLWINFGYEEVEKALVLYVTEGYLIHWPAALISEYLADLVQGTSTVVPIIEAPAYKVSYYSSPRAIAINISDLTSKAVESYKTTVQNAGWKVESDESSGYNAISPAHDVKINFYYDEYGIFNIDVFKYIDPVQGWPYAEIQRVLNDMGVTGEILPYTGEASRFVVDDYTMGDPVIYVYPPQSELKTGPVQYNKMLVDNGYTIYGTWCGDVVYYVEGTTVGYRAAYLMDDCFLIEIFDIRNIIL